eukprot:355034-Chlamydomonas_euryale.AAC.3
MVLVRRCCPSGSTAIADRTPVGLPSVLKKLGSPPAMRHACGAACSRAAREPGFCKAWPKCALGGGKRATPRLEKL